MPDRFIIVEKDVNLKDVGVFTGQIQIVDTHLHFWDKERTLPMQCMDGVSSPDIEHAFLFNDSYSAWRFALQFCPIWDPARQRYWGFRRWVARKDGDFFRGECRQGVDAHNAIKTGRYWIPQEAIIAATADGFEQGRLSVRAELQ